MLVSASVVYIALIIFNSIKEKRNEFNEHSKQSIIKEKDNIINVKNQTIESIYCNLMDYVEENTISIKSRYKFINKWVFSLSTSKIRDLLLEKTDLNPILNALDLLIKHYFKLEENDMVKISIVYREVARNLAWTLYDGKQPLEEGNIKDLLRDRKSTFYNITRKNANFIVHNDILKASKDGLYVNNQKIGFTNGSHICRKFKIKFTDDSTFLEFIVFISTIGVKLFPGSDNEEVIEIQNVFNKSIFSSLENDLLLSFLCFYLHKL